MSEDGYNFLVYNSRDEIIFDTKKEDDRMRASLKFDFDDKLIDIGSTTKVIFAY